MTGWEQDEGKGGVRDSGGGAGPDPALFPCSSHPPACSNPHTPWAFHVSWAFVLGKGPRLASSPQAYSTCLKPHVKRHVGICVSSSPLPYFRPRPLSPGAPGPSSADR